MTARKTTVWKAPKLTDSVKIAIHDRMVLGRATEEMLIRMMRTGHGYFWIGGPGEEGFNVPLGMLVKRGFGPDFDYLHLHYRSSATVLAMGSDPIDILRQMRSTATDPYSKGRNFVNHFAIKAWNIVPVTPTIETQHVTAIGTAIVQQRHGGEGLTLVTGGDAGSAEGDFWSCMNWATRPEAELPILVVLAQNQFGISTPASQTQNTRNLNDRANGFGIRNRAVDGNDPIAAYEAIAEAMAYVRSERRPYVLQANVSRLYGHSSSSGANRYDEADALGLYEQRLMKENLLTQAEIQTVWDKHNALLADGLKKVIEEPMPGKENVLQHVWHEE